LPTTINRLKKLELLDISNNAISDIRCISFMPELRILNVSGNKCLSTLPPELATCENLHDLVFDIEFISSPADDVLATGLQNILKFLSTGELTASSDYASEDKMIMQSKVTSSRIMGETISTTKKFMDKERFIMTQDDNFLENELHKEQQRKKEEMLKSLLEQQKVTENVVNKMQTVKDAERKKLIDDIVECKKVCGKFQTETNKILLFQPKNHQLWLFASCCHSRKALTRPCLSLKTMHVMLCWRK
jgi:hypothetical protein